MNAPKVPRNQGEGSPDDGVIDLTNPISSPFEDDAPIIDLTERVNSAARAIRRPPLRDADTDPILGESDGHLLDLENDRSPIDLLDDAIVFDDTDDTDRRTDDFVDSLGLEIEGPAAGMAGLQVPMPERHLETLAATALSPEKIESLLERVIEKVYAEKIEAIIVETVERVVNREIEQIRSALMGDDGE
jgi:hypothetical protein